ncbi:hypothetical protein Q7P36_005952 [Cladosporium allicinum]
MVLISTTEEIACSPAHLRKIFLDFPRLPQWTQGFIRGIEQQNPNKKTIEAGDKLTVKLEGMTFSPVVLENTPSQFKWRGSIPLLLNGDHFFRFEPSTLTPGGTTFTHGEEFSGVMAGPFSWFGMGSKAGPGFAKFNGDLKREAEKEVEAE